MSNDKNNAPRNYTEAQENLLRVAAASAPLNLARAKEIAADPRMSDADGNARNYRSIVAKINRMGLDYVTQSGLDKAGNVVTKKTDIVAKIAGIVNANMNGLEKAPKPALAAIAAYLESLGGEAEAGASEALASASEALAS